MAGVVASTLGTVANGTVAASVVVEDIANKAKQGETLDLKLGSMKHSSADYLEIGFLTLIAIVGCPLNVVTLMRLSKRYAQSMRTSQIDLKTAFTLLKINLNVSNLFILVLYCPFKMFWLVSYRWIAGDVVCRLAHGVWMLLFHANSNVIAALAIDQLRTVRLLADVASGRRQRTTLSNHQHVIQPVKRIMFIAWILAALVSIPQLNIWGTIRINKQIEQCMTVWERNSIKAIRAAKSGDVETGGDNYWSYYKEYLIGHAFVIFWLPLLVVAVSYAIMTAYLSRYTWRPSLLVNSERSMTDALSETELHETSALKNNDDEQLHPPPNQATALFRVPSLAASQDRQPRRLSRHLITVQSYKHRQSRCSSLVPGTIPDWRLQLRSRRFRTQAALVLCYVGCWLPYYILLLTTARRERLLDNDEHWSLRLLRQLMIVNAVLNPAIYAMDEA